MDWRNRLGLHGSYFFGVAAIGFILPFLPPLLDERGFSERSIGFIWTICALTSLIQFPTGLWSDRLGRRKPFLIAAQAVLTLATLLLPWVYKWYLVLPIVVLFAENGPCRSIVESLSGAEAAALSRPEHVGAAIGALRFWKPIGVVLTALLSGWIVKSHGLNNALYPLAVLQVLGLICVFLIQEPPHFSQENIQSREEPTGKRGLREIFLKDRGLWAFVAAMILFHIANAPGGVYLSLFLKKELHAGSNVLSTAFIVSMVAWMIVSRPAGGIADRVGRKPLLIAGWALMSLRLLFVSFAQTPTHVVINQALDGLSNGLFAVMAAAWVADRIPGRVGEAQAIVGTSLVLGSAIGPAAAGLFVRSLGYRGLFLSLGIVGALATSIVIFLVPETLSKTSRSPANPEGATTALGT